MPSITEPPAARRCATAPDSVLRSGTRHGRVSPLRPSVLTRGSAYSDLLHCWRYITDGLPFIPGSVTSKVSNRRTHLMNVIVWLVVGGLIGWAASAVMRTQEGMLLNVVVGILGAILGGWLLSPLVGVPTINQSNFSVPSLLVSLAGAVMLLAIVTLVRRGAPR